MDFGLGVDAAVEDQGFDPKGIRTPKRAGLPERVTNRNIEIGRVSGDRDLDEGDPDPVRTPLHREGRADLLHLVLGQGAERAQDPMFNPTRVADGLPQFVVRILFSSNGGRGLRQ